MSIATTRAAIQANNLTISGIVTAPTVMPNSLNDADLPAAIVFTSAAAWLHETFGEAGESERRSYDVRVYVKAVGQGEAGEAYETAETLLQAMGHNYLADRGIDGSIFHDWEITDGGVRGDLEYAGQMYVGFVLSLRAMTWE
jgi:hypothetical protein